MVLNGKRPRPWFGRGLFVFADQSEFDRELLTIHY